MMIASPGLLKTLEEATGTNNVNKELALLVVEQVNTNFVLPTFVLLFNMGFLFLFYNFSYECSLH